ncbi:MAG: hypothetical protein OHK0029_09150 [Armatimonadaceae bacterium]
MCKSDRFSNVARIRKDARPTAALNFCGIVTRTLCLFLVVFFALINPAYSQEDQAAPTSKTRRQTIVPFQPLRQEGSSLLNGMVITVGIERADEKEEGRLRLLVDTGASGCALKEAATKRFKTFKELPIKEGRVGRHKFKRAVLFDIVLLGTLRVGDVPFAVVPDKVFSESSPVLKDVDGVLGRNLLERFAVLLDFKQSAITFFAYGKLDENERQLQGFQGDVGFAALYPVDHGLYAVPASQKVPGITGDVLLLLDTGATLTYFEVPLGNRQGFTKIESEPIYTRTMDGVTHKLHRVSAEKIRFGTLALKEPSYYITDNYQNLDDVSGTLGLDVLSSFRVLMDFPSQRMYFKYPEQ